MSDGRSVLAVAHFADLDEIRSFNLDTYSTL
ncbi:hypothetical protein ALP12_200241 [Pseudomonas savastanoi pv. phaseolicola]|nr:hypothetical protein ALP12_200241 [Pseudomonas savastanoi pv. phaseolicola]